MGFQLLHEGEMEGHILCSDTNSSLLHLISGFTVSYIATTGCFVCCIVQDKVLGDHHILISQFWEEREPSSLNSCVLFGALN